MRLAVFTNQFPGRLNTFFARDMRALLECGIELEIFAFYPPDQGLWQHVPELLNPDILPRERVHHFRLADLALAGAPWPPSRAVPFARDAAPLLAAAARFGGGHVVKSAYASAYAWACTKRFGSERYDHVLAYWGNHAASVAYLFQRQTQPDVPFSMFVHARMDLYHQPAFLGAKMLYADNIFLVCEFNRGYLQQHFPDVYPRIADRIHVHHLGLPLEQIPFEPNHRAGNRLVAVGNLETLKGFAGLISAVASLRKRGIEVSLDLIGGGPQEGELRRLASSLGVEAHVTFRGWCSSDEVFSFMRQATALVHPSVAPDAMPTVVKEALAVGTPVIASDLAGIPEMLDGGRCGVLVPPGNIPAIEQAIANLLADPARRQALAGAGRAHMETGFDMWRNGRVLADRLRTTVRAERGPHAIAS
jgi:glycosyltransferase involved in cell wall biosynthesis